MGLDRESTKMFLNLRTLSQKVKNSTVTGSDTSEGLQGEIQVTEAHINGLIHDVSYRNNSNSRFRGSRSSCAAAANIYLYTFLRGLPSESTVFDWMSRLLMENLERSGNQIHTEYPAELLFWILIIGAGAAQRAPILSWYLTKLQEMRSGVLALDNWDGARMVLNKFCWIDAPMDSRHVEIWNRINGSR